jgi:pimeloyl-ACP methyl ester carboxylesterase
MGGYVALAFARAFPGRVLGLGLIDSQAAPDASERKTARYASAAQVASDGATAVVGMADKLTADPKFAPFLREIILRQPPQGLIGGLKAMAERPDATPALAEFHFPVVLVHGLADALIPPERSREMKALIPQAELVELPGMGHSPMLEAPAETARALLKLQGR